MIFWGIYLVGVLIVLAFMLKVGFQEEDEITLRDIFHSLIVSLGSWGIIAVYVLDTKLFDIVVWRKKKSNEDENTRV